MNYDQKQQLIFYLFLRIVILVVILKNSLVTKKFFCYRNPESIETIYSIIIETTNSKIISYIRYILLPTYFTKKKKSSPPWSNPQSNKSRSHNTNKNSRINFHTSNKSLSTKCLNTTPNIWLWRNLLITKKKKKKRESFHSIFAINLRSSLHEVEATRREIEN